MFDHRSHSIDIRYDSRRLKQSIHQVSVILISFWTVIFQLLQGKFSLLLLLNEEDLFITVFVQ